MQSFQEEDYTKRFDLSLWKKLLHIAKPFHKNLYAIAALMSISAIIDVLLPMMNSYAIDNIIGQQNMAKLPAFVAVYVGLVGLQVVDIFLTCGRAAMWKRGYATPSASRAFRSCRSCPSPTTTGCRWAICSAA